MKSRDSQVRLKLFQVNEKRRQVLQLDMMLADFERMAGELENQIGSEERKSGITDVSHFAYPTSPKPPASAATISWFHSGISKPSAKPPPPTSHWPKKSSPKPNSWKAAT
jgi:hypothetical protein